ncbi:MAG TPA: alkaline phosphatase family protein [Armatimonadota bacterium]|nr:alkaline phosphatase family protein [Armatimonadota bacterium]
MRLLIAGFDGIDPGVVESYGDAMPCLASLPYAAELVSEEILTWPIWTSMATGLPPSEHGVTGIFADEDAKRAWCRDDVKTGRFLWRALNDAGLSVGWYRVPVTSYPPRELDGWMASGTAGSPTGIWPVELSSAYEPGPANLWSKECLPIGSETRADIDRAGSALWDAARNALDAELESLLRLVEVSPVDVVFCYFNYTDTVQHHCFHDKSIMAQLHAWVDRAASRITGACDPDQTMILSDHGMRAVTPDDWGTHDKEGVWFTRSVFGNHSFFQSGMHRSPGLVRASFPLPPTLTPEDVYAVTCRACDIQGPPPA